MVLIAIYMAWSAGRLFLTQLQQFRLLVVGIVMMWNYATLRVPQRMEEIWNIHPKISFLG